MVTEVHNITLVQFLHAIVDPHTYERSGRNRTINHTFFNQQTTHFLLHHTTSFYNKINPTCFGSPMEPSSGN
jgi:hypothetical protein